MHISAPVPPARVRAQKVADLRGLIKWACAAQCLAAWHETCSWRLPDEKTQITLPAAATKVSEFSAPQDTMLGSLDDAGGLATPTGSRSCCRNVGRWGWDPEFVAFSGTVEAICFSDLLLRAGFCDGVRTSSCLVRSHSCNAR